MGLQRDGKVTKGLFLFFEFIGFLAVKVGILLAPFVKILGGFLVNTRSHITIKFYFIFIVLTLFLPHAKADLMDADEAEELAKKTFAEKYLEFTGDKNLMGKSLSVDGKAQLSGNKSRFDGDDGVSYRSDLTYHDLTFSSDDEAQKTEKGTGSTASKTSPRRLQPFVSPHGGLSDAGGSSILERTMYQQFDKFSKQEEKEDPNKPDDKKGIKFKGVFKITTKEIFEDPKSKQKNSDNSTATPSSQIDKNKDKEKDKVERLPLRDEVKQAVEKIGTDSAQTIIEAGKDTESKDDPNALPNELLLYDAAAKATTSLWNSTMANLYQRRIFKGLNDSSFFDPPKLSEESPDCSTWEKQQQEKIGKLNPTEQKDRQKEFELMKKGCEQMSKMGFNAVDPRYEADPNNPKVEILKERGTTKEDAFARDMRVQLELMSSAGKPISEVQTNWKYSAEDEKAELTNGDETVQQTMAEQLESYNAKLTEAKAAIDDIRKEVPSLYQDNVDPTQYRIEPGTRSLMDINQRPALPFNELGVDTSKLADPNPAQNYQELIKNVK